MKINNPFEKLLSRNSDEIIIMDGGMGTTVEDRGIDISTALWGSLALLTTEGRRITGEIHRDFFDAGAEILIANTHNAFRSACNDFMYSKDIDMTNLNELQAEGDDEKLRDAIHKYILQTAVDIARSVTPEDTSVVVATCIGSVDAPYATTSSVPADKAARWLEIELASRLTTGSDLLIFETLTTLDEIQGAAMASLTCGASHVAVGLTCGADGRTLAGVTMKEAVRQFAEVNPRVYFIQCTRYDYVEKALDKLKKALGPNDLLGVYANDGRGWDHIKMQWTGERISPEHYGEYVLRWRDAGVRIIGGCCGIGPEHIAHIKAVLSN
ncbi:MAG: homocysteine S-methyltransferase family protein [Calditrichaeota bacterium]|nr:homocysteine S-methyltransferase family protein [Calditrichota bacterium]